MKYLALALSVMAVPVAAQDFSEGSEAKEWGLYGESKARFAATVVDPLCELAGDCPDNCGDGRRQLALLREADDVMVLPLKNGQPVFSGAANELAPFCGQAVEVDGLLITDEELGAQNVYLVQKIRAAGAEDWTAANQWTKDWAAANPDAAGEGPWFRRDPRVLAEIEKEGWLGLGAEADAAFLEEWFQ
ncbi:MAG: hypothetical protein HUJ24_10565 [Rhodobacteraceae bacterium]|nr:hypothetical protein [Paracoccaceae bacterium]